MFENEFALDEESAGERLRDLRQEAGFTIEAACKFTSQIASTYRNPRLKISRALLSSIERDRFTPDIYQVLGLSLAYGCTVRDILRFYGVECDRTDLVRELLRKDRTEKSSTRFR